MFLTVDVLAIYKAKTNPASGREEDLNPGPPDYKSLAPQPLGHAASLVLLRFLAKSLFTIFPALRTNTVRDF